MRLSALGLLGALVLITTPQNAAFVSQALQISRCEAITQIHHPCGNSIGSNLHSSSLKSTHLGLFPTTFSIAKESVAKSFVRPSISFILSNALPLLVVIFSSLLSKSATIRQRILYPRVVGDTCKSEPLPPGSCGCPLFGTVAFLGSKSFGAGDFYRRACAKIGNPRVWKYYFMGQPFAVVSGKAMKHVLNMEFNEVTSSGIDFMDGGLLPMKSLLFERDKARHSFLRRLVGQSLTPSKMREAVPKLQEAAEIQVDKILAAGPDKKLAMSTICTEYTLDVAWRQILGLDLSEDEIPAFESAVDQWAKGATSLRVVFRIAVKSSPGFKAMMYVREKVKNKIAQLERDGPDSSTLSGMLFATDDEDPTKQLTLEEVVDNALILISAGSETSASTLTNAMLFLGLHPNAWNKLVEEQIKMKERHGNALSKESLDEECPYLEAVIKESMRMRAVSGGLPRQAKETLVIDGKQIPKGWLIAPSLVLTHELDPMTKEEGGAHVDAVTGFKPERWLHKDTRPSDDNFVAFGTGPRYCLGYNLAMAEMKVFLATLARKISFKLDNEESIEWKRGLSVIAKPSDGVLVTVKEAEGLRPIL